MTVAREGVLFLRHGNLWTGDSRRPRAESMLVRGDRILAVGSDEALSNLPEAAGAVRYELNGVSVLPGFSDCHIHVLASAKAMYAVDLSACGSFEEVRRRIEAHGASVPPDTWVYATNLNEARWDAPVLPDAETLDRIAIPNPLLIHRVCTHATLLNSRALELVGEEAFDGIAGVGRDAAGRLSGVLVEAAQLPAHRALRRSLYTRSRLLKYLEGFLERAASLGLTSLHTCGASSLGMVEDLSLYQEMQRLGTLRCRIFSVHDEFSVPPMSAGLRDGWVTYEGFKLFLDGSLGARTAALSSPYADAGGSGMLLHTHRYLMEAMEKAVERGNIILSHAIGDAAVEQLLDVIEALGAKGTVPAFPYLLNHVQVCRPDQLERMRTLPVACVVQPTYVASDIDMAPARLGDRERWTCMWKRFVDAGVMLCGSSDAPIEELNPLYAIWNLVNRTDEAGIREWNPDQKLTLDEALHVYTVNPARAYGTWGWNGSLSAGKAADFLILDRDLFAIHPMELREAAVAHTFVDGRATHGGLQGWP